MLRFFWIFHFLQWGGGGIVRTWRKREGIYKTWESETQIEMMRKQFGDREYSGTYRYSEKSSVVDPQWLFPDPDPTFQLVRILAHEFLFSNILNINFPLVLPSCKCVRLHIMTRYKLCMEIFVKGIYISIVHFCWEIVIRSSFISLWIRSCPDPEWFCSGSRSIKLEERA